MFAFPSCKSQLLTKTVFCLSVMLLSASHIPAQSSPPASAPSTTMPAVISMCEDSDGCSDWIFKGNQATGLWATGAVADLTITHLDATSITIHREDSRGGGKGIVADYTATISNYWIEGDVAATWAGHV